VESADTNSDSNAEYFSLHQPSSLEDNFSMQPSLFEEDSQPSSGIGESVLAREW
jgi:hypothetical protein